MTQLKNRLANETSPYLKQHAENPVDWYSWGEEAIEMAKLENKPILLSIGYSTCHWCHVMAEESFENNDIAALMNSLFINIKVDREERPDIDEIYMEAVQLMTRQGGWPLTVFLTPELEPIYGGTYFPPAARYGQPGFPDVLKAVSSYYKDNKDEVAARAKQLVGALRERAELASQARFSDHLKKENLRIEDVVDTLIPAYEQLLQELDSEADKRHGGYGRAPKFPQPSKISAQLFSQRENDVKQALLTLEKIATGGITDQLGGGVARYSVDNTWTVPHFEKMLYDNAQLMPLFAAASVIASDLAPSRAELFERTAKSIFAYLERDLKDAKTGLYYSAEDADSEGEEGRFYVFTDEELHEAFGGDVELQNFAKAYFKVVRGGNFEGTHILEAPASRAEFAKELEISEAALETKLFTVTKTLLQHRNQRPRPSLDNKSLLSWNALAVTGLLRTGTWLGDTGIAKRGLQLLDAIMTEFKSGDSFHHSIAEGEAKLPAFCDDLSYLLEATVDALALTGNEKYWREVVELGRQVHRDFVDESSGKLYFARADKLHLFRPHKPEDNVLPSPHSVIVSAIEKFFSWCGLNECPLERSDLTLLQKLSVTAAANSALLAQQAPLACAQLLQHIHWLQSRKTILVELESPKQRVSFSHLVSAHQAVLKKQTPVFVTNSFSIGQAGPDESDFFAQTNSTSVKFAFCDTQGCRLPTSKLSQIVSEL